MRKIEPLVFGKYYHIYNRGTNSCNVFTEEHNYKYFLDLYDRYIPDIADTFAWVLMKNHFHLLVRIKENTEMDSPTLSDSSKSAPDPSNQFSNLFNAYAQVFNKNNNRTGSLFEHPFKRKLVTDENYFKTLILYIHNNPVHHGLAKHTIEYPWSSYFTCISSKPTNLKRDISIACFDDINNFKEAHNLNSDFSELETWLDL